MDREHSDSESDVPIVAASGTIPDSTAPASAGAPKISTTPSAGGLGTAREMYLLATRRLGALLQRRAFSRWHDIVPRIQRDDTAISLGVFGSQYETATGRDPHPLVLSRIEALAESHQDTVTKMTRYQERTDQLLSMFVDRLDGLRQLIESRNNDEERVSLSSMEVPQRRDRPGPRQLPES